MAKYMKTEQGYKEIEEVNSNKMDANNPVGTGSFSMGRKPGSQIGNNSHAEGLNTIASGDRSHAEGIDTTASGFESHAEGTSTTASGNYSHAEGASTTASSDCSHAEGVSTTASGNYSHAEGYYTTASSNFQHVQGKFNVEDSENKYAHIVGNGISSINRSDAHTLDWKGNAWFAGDVYTGSISGTNKDAGSKKLATEEYVGNELTAKQDAGDYALRSEIPQVPVQSVNGQTGEVNLTASDVGALPDTTVIPSIDGLASESYVNTKVAGLVNSAPETLDTLNELAAALGNDANFSTTIATQIGGKVDKVDGKDLSTNDYTNEEKIKLSGIAVGAEINVQSDWNEADRNSDAYIKNKPTIPTVPDWAQTDTKPTYTAVEVGALPADTVIPVYKAGTGISIADDGTISVTVSQIYSGTTTPDNSIGVNGDIYIQTEG